MSLQNVLQRSVISCTRQSTIEEVAGLMNKENVGSILVIDAGKPVGIITDRDIVLRCVVKGLDCATMRAEEVMTPSPETVTVDCGILDVVKVMKKNQVRRVPVVDENGKAVGLLAFSDMYHLLSKEIADVQ